MTTEIMPTLTCNAKTFLSSGTSILSLPGCTETPNKDAGLIVASMPVLSGSSSATSLGVVILANAGSGYTPGIVILNVVQGGNTSGQITVTVGGGGTVTAINSISTPGAGYTVANGLATTVVGGGGGSNCTVNITQLTGLLSNADSDWAVGADLLGNTRTFDLQGRFTVADNTELWKFARDLDSIGHRDPQTLVYNQSNTWTSTNSWESNGSPIDHVGYVYNSVILNMSSTGLLTGSLAHTCTVYVNSANMTYTPGESNLVTYSIKLSEVSGSWSF